MTTELLDLFEEAKKIIDKQEELINRQQSIIKTMQQALQGVELNELLLKKQIAYTFHTPPSIILLLSM